MVNTKAAADVDVTELMRQFALMFPAFAAAASSNAAPVAPPAAAVPVAPPAAAVPIAPPAATVPVAPPAATVPVAPPAAAVPVAPPAESQVINVSAGAVFHCPSCDMVHYLVPSQSSPASSAADSVSAVASGSTPVTPSNVIRTGHFSAATGIAGDRWYGVVIGRQVGVFQNWQDVVEDLVTGVPGCKYKGFSSFAAAEQFFLNHLHMARIYLHPR